MDRSRRVPGGSLIPLIQLLSLVLVFALPALWGSKVFTSSPARYDRVVVHRGDTLWTLVSSRLTPSEDVGEAVYEASTINHLKADERLAPGRVLLLPQHQ